MKQVPAGGILLCARCLRSFLRNELQIHAVTDLHVYSLCLVYMFTPVALLLSAPFNNGFNITVFLCGILKFQALHIRVLLTSVYPHSTNKCSSGGRRGLSNFVDREVHVWFLPHLRFPMQQSYLLFLPHPFLFDFIVLVFQSFGGVGPVPFTCTA